ncbi:MAG: class I SAM-dependent methyltransferase [Acidimicrobiaceae bacterium]|nr:class I SAM-dependent methyltransferase [Acidimicrobiaceae bacterium]
MTTIEEPTYIPAAGRDWRLPFYDAMRWAFGAQPLARRLVEAAGPQAGEVVLDLATGTGAVALLLAERPGVQVIGVDPDPKALARAGRKARRAGVAERIRFERGYGQEIPVPDDSVDRVLCALAFHHLDAETKDRTLREVGRVLRPGGGLFVLDFGGHTTGADGWMARRVMRSELIRGNLGDAIPARMRAAGLTEVGEVESHVTARMGRVTLWHGAAPRA